MINLAGGLALFLGGWRHREQTYNFQGTSAFLAVVITLSVIAFILPTYTEATLRGSVTAVQSAGIIVVTLVTYFTFLFMQIGRHQHFFVEAESPDSLAAKSAAKPELGSSSASSRWTWEKSGRSRWFL